MVSKFSKNANFSKFFFCSKLLDAENVRLIRYLKVGYVLKNEKLAKQRKWD